MMKGSSESRKVKPSLHVVSVCTGDVQCMFNDTVKWK
jgi:hypothetical protein